MEISNRVNQLKPSATLTINMIANELKSQGVDVINLSAGQPDFTTPENIKNAGIDAIKNNFTYYTPATGIKELKEAIAKKLKRENNLDYSLKQIIVSCGAKHNVFNACFTLLNEGDEALIISPYWVSYYSIIQLCGAMPVIINAKLENDLKVTVDQLQKHYSKNIKAIILNNPTNPTGTFYNRDELLAVCNFCLENNITIISDEIYEKLVYDGNTFISCASLSKEIYDNTITINGVSKSYAMTGWRIGYAAGPEKLVTAMGNLQGHCTSNPTSISQKASIEALDNSDDSVSKMIEQFEKRRNFVYEKLSNMEGIEVFKPKGAFYIFPKVSAYYGKKFNNTIIKNSTEFCEYLLKVVNVAAVPGIAFGNDEYIRISYATSMENLEKAMERLEKYLPLLK